MTKLSWTQPLCDRCWTDTHDRPPVRIAEEHRDTETCALCGEPTRDGIYVRMDPATVRFPAWDA